MSAHLSLSSSVLLSPRRTGLCAGSDNEVDVLVRVQAADAPAEHHGVRPPMALALVVDRSGSMSGQPLREARRCAAWLIGHLRPGDRVGLAQFDHRVQRLWPAAPLGDGAGLRAALERIDAGGNTDLHGGWREGADLLADAADVGLRRVVLLSDGCANAGLTRTDAIAAACAQVAQQGVSTSTFGLGRSFNEELMVAMARAGGGQSYYGETAEDLMEPFEQEFELLSNVCLRELRLTAAVPDGCSVEVVNRLPQFEDGWRLPDLAWGAEAWAVLRIRVPAQALPRGGLALTVLRVGVKGLSAEAESVQLERAGLSLPVLTPGAFGGLADDEVVTRRLLELAASDAMMAMRDAAGQGRWDEVDRMLAESSRRFAGHDWVTSMLAAMQAIAAERDVEGSRKEMFYASQKLRSRLAAKFETADLPEVAHDAIPAFLRRKPRQGRGDLS